MQANPNQDGSDLLTFPANPKSAEVLVPTWQRQADRQRHATPRHARFTAFASFAQGRSPKKRNPDVLPGFLW